ncbi:cuticlin-5 [Tenebrio molitor]|uniref:cuticlin-5 n=1 Tax=Tenebrio molitor TaxID=7067 RepID=UPI003624867B
MLSPLRHLRRLLLLPVICCFSFILLLINVVDGAGDLWPLDRPDGMPSIQSLEVMCGKDHMDVHLTFSQPFEGIVSSKGQHGDPRCVYVPPSTGQTFFSFRIAYARCGTKPDLHGQFYENTVVVQYDKDLLEVWDEAKRLRCEWFNDYEKTASKPPMVIADLDVVQLDFRGDNVDCWMEIQHGKGPWAPPVSGIVPLGSTLTLVVAINDYRGEFDMRVKSCVASDGGGHVIQLSDEFGCVLRPKMISRFLKARGADERASVITYAFFHAFKFPDALSVHIKCKVEICRHGCLDHCQIQPDKGDVDSDLYLGPLDRKDDKIGEKHAQEPDRPAADLLYDDIIGEEGVDGVSAVKMSLNAQLGDKPMSNNPDGLLDDDKELDITAVPHKDMFLMHDQFPHGPRTFEDRPVAAPRAFSKAPPLERLKRKRRSITISDRKARSADVGVSGLYEVISEADLAFSPDSRAEAVTVFQGRIREEVVYGICMPVPGFSVLFVLVAVSAVVSALVAGSLLYRYQLQKEQLAEQARNGPIPMGIFSGWTGWRLLRMRGAPPPQANGTNDKRVRASQINGKTDETQRNCE